MILNSKKTPWVFFLSLLFSTPILCTSFFLYINLPLGASILNTLLVPLAILIFLCVNKKKGFLFGFFVGLILFHWVGLSLRFSPYPFLAPAISLIVAGVYGLIFYFILYFENILTRILALFSIDYIHPFYFDWLQIKSFLAYSPFGVQTEYFLSLSIACALFSLYIQSSHLPFNSKIPNAYKLFLTSKKNLALAVFFLSLSFMHSNFYQTQPPVLPKIALAQTDIPQNELWNPTFFHQNKSTLIKIIKNVKNAGFEAILLPESSLPHSLNLDFELMKELSELSKNFTIVLGSMRKNLEDGTFFNSAYIFSNNSTQIIDKTVLAPFGEKIPLPDFMAKPISEIFFGTSKLFEKAPNPKNYFIKGIEFRSAICYEATSSSFYQKTPIPALMTVLSNNAWFQPSIEPYFQQILLKYYARLNQVTILHSANASRSEIITPSLKISNKVKHEIETKIMTIKDIFEKPFIQ